MFFLKKYFTTLIIVAAACSFSSSAEQPKAGDLVGKVYGGIHAMHIKTDHDRLMTDASNSSLNSGNGFGAELGYRWLPSTEFRFSYSQFKLSARNNGYSVPDGASTSIDMLFFPTEKNFYVLAGANNLDIKNSQISANIGAGYRHYLNERMGLYFETKAHYQFSEHYDDLTAQVGFVYFFGDSEKALPVKAAAVVPVLLDSDNDGVVDEGDRCPNTPMTDKVEKFGCTVFIEDEISIQLLVEFDNNKSIIKPKYNNEISAMATFLNAYPDTSIDIEGHASTPGSKIHNKKLSQQRAEAIVNMLVTKYNISPSRLNAKGYGEEKLLSSSNDEASHAKNRRIIANVNVNKKIAVKR